MTDTCETSFMSTFCCPEKREFKSPGTTGLGAGIAVSIATRYRVDQTVGVRVPVRARFFSSLHRRDRLVGPSSLLSLHFN
jgi:hypothetical protein